MNVRVAAVKGNIYMKPYTKATASWKK